MSDEQRGLPIESASPARADLESGTQGLPRPERQTWATQAEGDRSAAATAPAWASAGAAEPRPSWPPQAAPAWPPQAAPAWPAQEGGEGDSQPSWQSYYGAPAAPPSWSPTPPEPRRRRMPLLATGLAMLLVFAVGIGIGFGAGRTGTAAATTSQPLSGFDLYNQAVQLIDKNYVNRSDVTDQTLVYGSIRGLVEALGDTGHSTFLTPDELKAEQQALNAKLTGIGVIGSDSTGVPSVLRVLPGSPAEKAGMKPGDQIVAVDGTSTSGMTFSQAAQKIRGPAGTKVTLSILHPGAATPVDLTITRAEVNVPLVDWAMVPGTKIADILLLQFGSGAADELKTALSQAKQKGATGIILDLRGNPGGYVGEAVNVASQFLSTGVVYQERSANGSVKNIPINKDEPHTNLPLVVLVDHDSASASEIVSGALQSNGRAKIVGVKTYGTGTVLQTFPLKDGSALMLGVADWLTPKGERIFGNGIAPDVVSALPSGAAPTDPFDLQSMTAAQFSQTKDAQLQAALKALGES